MTTSDAAPRPVALWPLAPLALTAVCLLWAFWTTLAELAQTWNGNPQYSHGWLVPVFAGFLLWMRRDQVRTEDLRPSLWGLALLATGLTMRLAATYWYFVSLDALSIIPCVAGVVLLFGGWAGLRWAWPAVLFLAFMIPLPHRVATSMAGPLQRVATVASTYVMQAMGLPALAEGNVIQLNEHPLNIVEACSGLRMLVVFFALSTAVVLVIQRHWIDKTIIILSAVPIALLSNLIRIVTTGVLYELGLGETAKHFFHDVAGWVMMPLALGMLWLELKLLGALFIDEPEKTSRPISNPTRRAAQAAPQPRVPRSRRAKPEATPAPEQEPVEQQN